MLHALELLRLLAQAGGPVSATELAHQTGQHPSSVSRLLSGLARAGYIRKPDYHSFAIGLGLLTLLGRVRQHFPLVGICRPILQAQAGAMPGTRLSLATVHDSQLIYWLIVEAGQEPIELVAGGFPLHLSSIALRRLLESPRSEALAQLRTSRRRHGWERPTQAVPIDEAAVLREAEGLLADGVLMLERWQAPDAFSAAVRLSAPGEDGLLLALSGTISRATTRSAVTRSLRDAAALVEQGLAQRTAPPA